MLNYNGKIYTDKNTPLFSAQNRAFSYADALFETIRIRNNNLNYSIPLWDYHFKRLSKGMAAYGYDKLASNFLKNEILKTAYSIKSTKSDFKARLTVFRGEGGLYTPTNSNAEFVIVLQEIPKLTIFDTNTIENLENFQRSYVFFDELPLFFSNFSAFKKTDALPYILAGKSRKEQQADEVFLLNNNDKIAEAGAANVFILDTKISNPNNSKQNQFHFITPPTSEGGVMGTMRNYILDNYKVDNQNKVEISIEEKTITKTELNQSEIIFTTNAVQSIQIIKITTQKQLEIMKNWINEMNRAFIGDIS
ncbi:branched-chain amino acid aminotransferase/4-amino-4-deoxychorismate lyase [Bernardetia litoralis DSM 6794]|uniref:branched-chain-amino-acid transaminase n=1 Tax=Bernardetia litoralis (strain ATCC 23117 / DSM 6794 / NBRC 15988 / NCIMB 1366 / Fx l1 / Sio-4) TaxID=880071 RepID=I4ANJ1_BERLS|nr:aminotransferase class IV [Bernardetia litoralis]AFM05526.1 branched-chain amino acid aminotransferase/4-amino-4-deoxychorismate lyase [Bernardetia litoralis DSM 6794]